MGFWIYPDEGVVPSICKFNFDQVVASGAPWSTRLEDSVRAFAVAANVFQHELSAFVSRNSRRAAGFAEGFHFRRSDLCKPAPNTPER
jgi:hypothetical protein